jgi:predicted nucleic acid-binding protein
VKQTFADSFYLLAIFNGRDAAHELALAASKELQGVLVTTDWVRSGCADFIDDLRRSPRVEVEPASRALFDAGLGLYRQRADKGWSLTDCISFVVMQDRKMTDALTGDHHFEQAGFRALLK